MSEYPNWGKVALVTIANASGQAVADAVVRIDLSSRSDLDWTLFSADGSDIRVTASNLTTVLPFYREASFDKTGHVGFINVRTPIAAVGTTIALFYNKASQPDASSFTSTFTNLPITSAAKTLAAWEMNDGSGATAVDSSGNSKALTLVGSPTWSAEIGAWNYSGPTFTGSSVTFNGTTQHAEVVLLDNMPASGTIAFSLKGNAGFNDGATAMRVFYIEWANGHVFSFRPHPGSPVHYLIDIGTDQLVITPVTTTNGTVYEFAFTWTPTNFKVFRSNPLTLVTDTLVDSFQRMMPGPDTASPWQTAASGAGKLTFAAKQTPAGVISERAPITLNNIIIESRPWTKDEFTDRRVLRKNHIPSTERDYWVKGATANGLTLGEKSSYYDPATQRIHQVGPNSTVNGAIYRYSDDYGQTWSGSTAVTVSGLSGTFAHSCIFVDSDGYCYLYFSDDTKNIWCAKSTTTANPTRFTTFSAKSLVLNADTASITVTSQFANTSVTKKGSTYYMAVEGNLSGVWKTWFCTCATPQGTFAPISTTTPAGLYIALDGSGHGDIQAACPCLLYDADYDKWHLFYGNGYTTLPSEVVHATSTNDCVTWTRVTADKPVWFIDQYDSVQTAGSNSRDQIGDPDITVAHLLDGTTRLIGIGIMLNNHLVPPAGDSWTYTFNGTLHGLENTAAVTYSIGASSDPAAPVYPSPRRLLNLDKSQSPRAPRSRRIAR